MNLEKVKILETERIILENYEFLVNVNSVNKRFDVIVTKGLNNGTLSIVIKEGEFAIGIINKDSFFVSYDSNGDGKVDQNDESYKIMEIVRDYFKENK